jgi:hypothetical protein
VILDHKLKPYLIEVNSSPSFGSDTPLDKKIKKDLIYDTVKMLNLNAKRKAQLKKMKQEEFNRRQTGQKVSKQEKEAAKAKNQRLRDKFDNENLGDYHPIFPHPDPKVQAQFQNMLEVSARLWQDFTSGVSRTTLNQAKQGQPDPKAHKLLKDPRKTEPLPKSKAKGIATNASTNFHNVSSRVATIWQDQKSVGSQEAVFLRRNQNTLSPDPPENPEEQALSASANKIFHKHQLGLHDSPELCLACEKPLFAQNHPQFYYNQTTFCLCQQTQGRIASPVK